MSATIKQTKTLTTLDLAIRTLKPRNAQASESSEKQDARVVVVTHF